jgi:hypothetical protein
MFQLQQQPCILFSRKLGRLEMNPHEQRKNRYKTRAKNKKKTRTIKNQIKKEKTIKH